MTEVTLLIDASNVCRDKSLAPVGADADWGRVEALLSSISSEETIDYAGYYLVADESLRRRLSRGDRELYDAARAAGHLEERLVADTRLVELVHGSDRGFPNPLIVTNDFLDDFRRTHPELNDSEAISWTADADGRPRPVRRPFGKRTHQRLSHKEEEGELRRRKLVRRDIQDQAARWYFRCKSERCAVAQFWPDHLEELPLYDPDRGCFACPGVNCGEPLEQLGERAPAVAVLVLQGDDEIARLLVEDGVEIGRSDGAGCIGLNRFMSEDACSAVSRRHVRVLVNGDDVLVEDLGSKNGTRLERRRDRGEPLDLRQGRQIVWATRDIVVLPGGITLERSGRRLPFRGDQALPDAPEVAAGSETRMITRPPR